MAILEQQWSVRLLGRWQLFCGGVPVDIGVRQQRVIAALALLGANPRRSIAIRLWPDSPDARASGNLRASLFRILHEQPGLIQAPRDGIRLDPRVEIDVTALRSNIDEVLRIRDDVATEALMVELRGADLLPEWSDDWVVMERERLDQQRLLAFEAVARRCLKVGDFDRAVEVATMAVGMASLRESAYFLLMRAHLAAGNRALAAQVYQRLSDTLAAELGIAPSAPFEQLIDLGLRQSGVGVTLR
ncbi:AfsR/SARP family transcriptional regulator [Agromyces albus]|uniref:SARP family transcriptional regulator n=1 Tax=Agromyces albus TaxID=205332 RepID=A0A4Q2KSJ1_9MICO|nr:BTAD domain-containing putative transcriptional regulator [Agromyces albus]RXZ68444.1 SARP family transcriptional regulator [Agromyces albus]